MDKKPPLLSQAVWTPGFDMFDPKDEKDDSWGCFLNGGVEFPIIDFGNRAGYHYENFWANGFGSFMPDR